MPKPSKLREVLVRDSPCVQDIGDVITKTHRSVAFPNLYQHQVQPFRLEDSTKPGHRKILVFFLVDPTQKIPSATDVAPQQHEWVTEALHGAGRDSAFAKLPLELLTMISNENEGAMTRLEAEKYREELMSERTVFVEANDKAYFGMVRTRLRSIKTRYLTLCFWIGIQYVVRLHFRLAKTYFNQRPSFTANTNVVYVRGQKCCNRTTVACGGIPDHVRL